jgi:hypothetical protein
LKTQTNNQSINKSIENSNKEERSIQFKEKNTNKLSVSFHCGFVSFLTAEKKHKIGMSFSKINRLQKSAIVKNMISYRFSEAFQQSFPLCPKSLLDKTLVSVYHKDRYHSTLQTKFVHTLKKGIKEIERKRMDFL